MQGLGRLGLAKRAGPIAFKEAWTVEAGYDEDGAGGYVILG